MNTAAMAEIAALAGDPARACMLQALMDGRALTATELAHCAGVAPQTASGHLGQLTRAGLLSVERQGRHRYHRLASPAVARMLEGLMLVAAESRPPARAHVAGPRDEKMRAARTCYDHLAGRLGVGIADAMAARGYIEFSEDAGMVTAAGEQFLARLGISVEAPAHGARPARTSRPLCRPCLDWSERRWHLAGRLGAALCRHCLDRGWVRRRSAERALDITPSGARAFREVFGVSGGAILS
jgi:DNA-binding transcriptional ArsR family regulator